jgi:hypothetical protein
VAGHYLVVPTGLGNPSPRGLSHVDWRGRGGYTRRPDVGAPDAVDPGVGDGDQFTERVSHPGVLVIAPHHLGSIAVDPQSLGSAHDCSVERLLPGPKP